MDAELQMMDFPAENEILDVYLSSVCFLAKCDVAVIVA